MAGFLPNPADAFALAFGLKKANAPALLPKLAQTEGMDFATQLALLQRKMEEAGLLKAKAMRDRATGEMVSGHYVPNYGGMVADAIGGMVGRSREEDLAKQAAELAAAQQQAQTEWLGQMPTGQAAIAPQQMGPGLPVEMGGGEGVVEGPAPMQPGQAAKPPSQQEIMAWAAKGMGISPDIAKGVTNKVVGGQIDKLFDDSGKDRWQVVGGRLFDKVNQTFVDMPESEADRLKRQEQREIKMAEIEQRAEAARLRSEDARLSVEQRRQAAAESAALRRELAGMNADLRRELSGGKEAKGSQKERAEAAARQGQMSAIDEAIAAVEAPENAAAFDWKQRTAGMVGGPVQGMAQSGLTDSQQNARNLAFNITGDFVHQRYGAALSAHEKAKAETYLPAESDPPNVVARKLRSLRNYLNVLDAKYGIKDGAPAPGATPAPKAGAPAAPAADAALRSKYGL